MVSKARDVGHSPGPEFAEVLDSVRHELAADRDSLLSAVEGNLTWLLEHARSETRATYAGELERVEQGLAAAIQAEQVARARTDDAVRGVGADLLQRAQTLTDAIRGEIEAREEVAARLALLESAHAEQVELIDGLRQEVQRLKARGSDPERVMAPAPLAPGSASAEAVPAELYLAIEDRFRGSREAVSELQRVYLPYLQDVVSPDHPLVDLGAGRGELVKLCSDAGLAAYGVDGNADSVRAAQEAGADVRAGELGDFLRSVEAGSLGAITLMHVVEHFSMSGVLGILRAVQRALMPGGLLIAETPNPANVRVGAGTFWIDPTHQRPLHPDLLAFLAEEAGFDRIEVLPLHPARPKPDLVDVPDAVVDTLNDAWEALSGPQDYALLAWTLPD